MLHTSCLKKWLTSDQRPASLVKNNQNITVTEDDIDNLDVVKLYKMICRTKI